MASFLGYDLVLDSDTSGSQNVTVPVGTDYVVIVEAGYHASSSPSLSALTLDGNSLLPVAGTQDGPASCNDVRIYHKAYSGSGTKNVSFTRSTSWTEGGGLICMFCSGVSGSRDISLATPGDGPGSLNDNLTTESGDLILVAGFGFHSSNVDVDLASQTKIFEENTTAFNSDCYGAAYNTASGTSTNVQISGGYLGAAAIALISSTVSNSLFYYKA